MIAIGFFAMLATFLSVAVNVWTVSNKCLTRDWISVRVCSNLKIRFRTKQLKEAVFKFA